MCRVVRECVVVVDVDRRWREHVRVGVRRVPRGRRVSSARRGRAGRLSRSAAAAVRPTRLPRRRTRPLLARLPPLTRRTRRGANRRAQVRNDYAASIYTNYY